jgi:peptide/nickel transport system substrate-binding protein
MAKSERLFEMLQYIREYPNLTAQDLARLCRVSERGVYRYLNTLSRAGIPVHFQDGGYRLSEDVPDLLKKVDVEGLRAIVRLLTIGMSNCEDRELLRHGRSFMRLIDDNLPKTPGRQSDEIEIVPAGMEASNYGGTISIGHSSKPDIINPILTSETISVTLMNLIFSGLLSFDSSGKANPDVARDWEVSRDGMTWSFLLRDDVRFHDGHPLTSHDVEFTYRSMMDPGVESPMSERYGVIDRIETEGDHVFRVVLKYPFAPFTHRLYRAIAPMHLLAGEDLRDSAFNREPVGSGPFKLVEWTDDNTIVLDANEDYFRKGRPILDRLILKSYPDREEALQAITRGEMDVALDLAASDLLFVSRNGGFRIYPAIGSSYYALFFDLRNPLFRDMRVRMAFDYAIDRESIVRNQLKGYSKVCTGPFSVNSWAYNHDIHPIPYHVGNARELLRQVGWTDTDGDGVLDKDGKPFEVSITVPNISDSLERVAVAIRAQLMKVGIKVKLVYMDELAKSEFQAFLARTTAGADPDYAYRIWHSEGGDLNLSSYRNRFVDELLELGRRTVDLEKRKAIYHKAHEIIHDDYPAIFLASGFEFIGSSYRFRDARFSSTLHFLTTMRDWQIVSEEGEGVARERERKAGVVM